MADTKRQSMNAKTQQATGSGAAAPTDEALSKAIGARYVLWKKLRLVDNSKCSIIAFASQQQLQTHPPSKVLFLPPAL